MLNYKSSFKLLTLSETFFSKKHVEMGTNKRNNGNLITDHYFITEIFIILMREFEAHTNKWFLQSHRLCRENNVRIHILSQQNQEQTENCLYRKKNLHSYKNY